MDRRRAALLVLVLVLAAVLWIAWDAVYLWVRPPPPHFPPTPLHPHASGAALPSVPAFAAAHGVTVVRIGVLIDTLVLPSSWLSDSGATSWLGVGSPVRTLIDSFEAHAFQPNRARAAAWLLNQHVPTALASPSIALYASDRDRRDKDVGRITRTPTTDTNRDGTAAATPPSGPRTLYELYYYVLLDNDDLQLRGTSSPSAPATKRTTSSSSAAATVPVPSATASDATAIPVDAAPEPERVMRLSAKRVPAHGIDAQQYQSLLTAQRLYERRSVYSHHSGVEYLVVADPRVVLTADMPAPMWAAAASASATLTGAAVTADVPLATVVWNGPGASSAVSGATAALIGPRLYAGPSTELVELWASVTTSIFTSQAAQAQLKSKAQLDVSAFRRLYDEELVLSPSTNPLPATAPIALRQIRAAPPSPTPAPAGSSSAVVTVATGASKSASASGADGGARRYAFVTLLLTDMYPDKGNYQWREYLEATIVMIESLKRHSRRGEIVVLVTGVFEPGALAPLERLGARIVAADPLCYEPSPKPCSFFKLRMWQLTEYHRVVHVDSDMLVLHDVDALFDQPQLTAVKDFLAPVSYPDHPYDGFNAGMMVLEPSQQTFDALQQSLLTRHPPPRTEQEYLNWFFRSWRRLTYEWNASVLLAHFAGAEPDLVANAWDLSVVRILHYICKPWKSRCDHGSKTSYAAVERAWFDAYIQAFHATGPNDADGQPLVLWERAQRFVRTGSISAATASTAPVSAALLCAAAVLIGFLSRL